MPLLKCTSLPSPCDLTRPFNIVCLNADIPILGYLFTLYKKKSERFIFPMLFLAFSSLFALPGRLTTHYTRSLLHYLNAKTKELMSSCYMV